MTQPPPAPRGPPPSLGLCSACKFWDQIDQAGVAGLCRFNAPGRVLPPVASNAVWPKSRSTDWCGEWLVRS